jgi:hypothetical protein
MAFRLEDTQEYQDLLRQQEAAQSRTPATAIAQALQAKNVGPVAADPSSKAQREYDYATQSPEVVRQGIAMLPESMQSVAEFFAPSRADLLTAGVTKLGTMAARATGLMKPASGMVRELITYHGTPHRFPEAPDNPLGAFDASKIGTGEGSQAYAHGLYFAEKPQVARNYKTALQGGPMGINIMDAVLKVLGVPYDEAATQPMFIDSVRRVAGEGEDAVRDAIIQASKRMAASEWPYNQRAAGGVRALADNPAVVKAINEEAGSLYTADLPDEMIDRMLDWDAPLSKQPKEIVERLTPENLGLTYTQFPNGNHGFVNARGEVLGSVQQGGSPESFRQDWMKELLKRTGRDLYKQLGQGPSKNKAASEALRNAGIPGVKYLDAGSRFAGGSGTRNFVVFPGEEQNVKILNRE